MPSEICKVELIEFADGSRRIEISEPLTGAGILEIVREASLILPRQNIPFCKCECHDLTAADIDAVLAKKEPHAD